MVVINENQPGDKSPLGSTTSSDSPTSTVITAGNGAEAPKMAIIPPPISTVTNVSANPPEDNTAHTKSDESKKIDLHGDKPTDPAPKRPSPRLDQVYLQESESYLLEVSNSEIWKDLVDTWLRFETNCPQRGVSKLLFFLIRKLIILQAILTKNRPEQVAWWLKRGRKANVVPTIENPKEFAIAWQGWWEAMQPDWRRNDDKDLTRTAPHDKTDSAWSDSKLLRSGPVGFRLIIMALAWWGQVVNLEVQDKGEARKFFEAVEDVQWVLNQVLISFAPEPMTKKRSMDNEEPYGSNKK